MQKLLIEKLVHGGQGLARHDGKTWFVWNALPGEEVEVEILKKKANIIEAVATTILNPSPERITPTEPSFLSTSPWQILDPDREHYWKRAIATETYSKIGDLILRPQDISIASDDIMYGYRNKMEFSFTECDDGTISLAFFERGKKKRFAVSGSALATNEINETATSILQWINQHQISMRSLKSIIIRSADVPAPPPNTLQSREGDHSTDSLTKKDAKRSTIAALFIKDELSFDAYPNLNETMVGFQLYYSTHKSPASVPTKLLYSAGQDYLTEHLLGTTLKFGALSFFQVNVPVFELALKDIAAFLHPTIPIIDLYSGVGSISLPLSLNREQAVLVDNNEEAIQYAKENIVLNRRQYTEARCIPAEKITEIIAENTMIIVDPPRAGLHQEVVKQLLIKRPPRIIYLSCDIATHARDIRLLGQAYKISFLKLYNFFPRTPHIEGLCVLDII